MLCFPKTMMWRRETPSIVPYHTAAGEVQLAMTPPSLRKMDHLLSSSHSHQHTDLYTIVPTDLHCLAVMMLYWPVVRTGISCAASE